MGWARLDDQFWSNPKIVAAGNEGAGIYARALCYCSANETDGFIPLTIARQIASRARAREKPEMNQLWTKVEPGDRFTISGRKDSGRRKLPDVVVTIEAHGYYIRDYLHYNRARSDVRAHEIADEIANVQFECASARAESAHKDARAARPVPKELNPSFLPRQPEDGKEGWIEEMVETDPAFDFDNVLKDIA